MQATERKRYSTMGAMKQVKRRQMPKLRPCPYCGNDAQHYPQSDGQANAIYCKTCPVGVEQSEMPDDELARVWNGLPRRMQA